jgi:hypothetical protein
MFMTKNIDLEKKEENLLYKKNFYERCSLFFFNRVNSRFLVNLSHSDQDVESWQ